MFYIIFPGLIETYITLSGLFQMMPMKHAIEVAKSTQQSRTISFESQRTEESTAPDA